MLALPGCSTLEARLARDPRGMLIGGNIVDAMSEIGTPAHLTPVIDSRGPAYDRLLVQWDFSNNDSAFSVTLPLVGFGLQVGGAGKCSIVATVGRMGGTVYDIGITQAHVDGLEPNTTACAPLLDEAAHHPSSTYLPPGFDAFTLVDPKGGLHPAPAPRAVAATGPVR